MAARLKLHNYAELAAAVSKKPRSYEMSVSSPEEFDSEEFDEPSFGEDSLTTSESEANAPRPLPISRHDTKYLREKRRSQRPPCGVNALQFPSLSTIPNISSSFDDDDLSDPLYTPIRKQPPLFPLPHKDTPRRPRRLTMIQEVSPIMPVDDDLPLVPSLKLNRDWRPQQTSTTTSFQHVLPKTNPHHKGYGVKGLGCSTPRVQFRDRPLSLHKPNDFLERPSSFYSDSGELSSREWESLRPVPMKCRPEEFGLPGSVAKNMGSKGILFLTMSLTHKVLTVTVHNAVFFSDQKNDLSQVSSFVRLGLKRVERHRETRKRVSSRSQNYRTSQTCRTNLVRRTNRPAFREEFDFQLDHEVRHGSYYLSVSVQVVNPEDLERMSTLGCMAFPIRRLLKKAKEGICDENYPQGGRVVVNDGGFFLLNAKTGDRNNLPQTKINVHTYYDDQAFSGHLTTSSSSLNMHSTTPNKMMRDEWRVDDAGAGGLSLASSSSPFGVSDKATRIPAASYSQRTSILRPRHDYSTGSSSTSGVDFNHHGYRLTLPSITTSECDSSSQADVPAQPNPYGGDINYAYLYADQAAPSNDEKKRDNVPTANVRRAASFTFSPQGTSGKHNRRPQAPGVDDDKKRKFHFGPLSKTISYIRNKMDTALSTSTLYPTKEEVRQWPHSFESLLNHKYGCMLFRQFLKKEFSEENLDFWLECEDFKRMKEGKAKTHAKAQAIYKEYVAEQAPKEVNLDSDTRAATKAALEEASCRSDTFSLAQAKIEQLMAKDPFKRFVKDRLYLDLLEDERDVENDDVK